MGPPLSRTAAVSLSALATSFFTVLAYLFVSGLRYGAPWLMILAPLFFFAVLVVFSFRGPANTLPSFAVCFLLLTAAFLIRFSRFDFTSNDYKTFLIDWMFHFIKNGAWGGLKDSLGNYNVPYLYILAFLSKFSANSLYLIKAVSVAFDFLLALYAMRFAACFPNRAGRAC